MYIVVMPVTFSPAIIARSIGAAPLYLGSKDAWTLMHPLGGISRIPLGTRSPCDYHYHIRIISLRMSTHSCPFSVPGVYTGILLASANTLTR